MVEDRITFFYIFVFLKNYTCFYRMFDSNVIYKKMYLILFNKKFKKKNKIKTIYTLLNHCKCNYQFDKQDF